MGRFFAESLDLAKVVERAINTQLKHLVLGPPGGGQVLVIPSLGGRILDTTTAGLEEEGVSFVNEDAMHKGTGGYLNPGNFGGLDVLRWGPEALCCFYSGTPRTVDRYWTPRQWDFSRFFIASQLKPQSPVSSVKMQSTLPIQWVNYFREKISMSVTKRIDLCLNPLRDDDRLNSFFNEPGHYVGYRVTVEATNVGNRPLSIDGRNAVALLAVAQFDAAPQSNWIVPITRARDAPLLWDCSQSIHSRQPQAQLTDDYLSVPTKSDTRAIWGVPLGRYCQRVAYYDPSRGELVIFIYNIRDRQADFLKQAWNCTPTERGTLAESLLCPHKPVVGLNYGHRSESGNAAWPCGISLYGPYMGIPVNGSVVLTYHCLRYKGPEETLRKIAADKALLGVTIK
ncbi:MAG TPA: DUF6786 family protein [Candidatus Nanoarchaeia archaeon]|nr:DUF6786 family protein [Candidatus Nanoarchaeia archaeon]